MYMYTVHVLTACTCTCLYYLYRNLNRYLITVTIAGWSWFIVSRSNSILSWGSSVPVDNNTLNDSHSGSG